ncbi:MAG: DUF4346 domain-containing protein [Candidatus Aenigmarchaeota archaeon]|nr:DUF4346 domain-containing protein [Candidatus Aenigmarchaeota archaeon]
MELAIVTLWTKKENVTSKLRVPYYVVGQLYSKADGISILIRNCLANKKIRHLVITGSDLQGSGEALAKLFHNGVDDKNVIIGTDTQLEKEIPKAAIDNFRQHVKLHDKRELIDFSQLNVFITALPKLGSYGPAETFPKAEIDVPESFPTDRMIFRIRSKYVGEAWLKILFNVMRFGYIKRSKYADDIKELVNICTVIEGEDPDEPVLQDYLSFSKEELDEYIETVTTPKHIEGVLYTYGQRLRNYNGIDQIKFIIEDVKKMRDSRRAIAFTWNVEKDMWADHAPCIDMVHVLVQDKLYMTAYIRSNDMFNAWPKNAFALRKLQYMISEGTGIEPGSLTVISGSAHIYARDFGKALSIIENFPIENNKIGDPRGNFLIRVDGRKIVVDHLDHAGHKIDSFSGKTAAELYKKMAHECRVSDFGHAYDLGAELQKAEIALNLGIKYVQDRELEF